MAIKISCPRCQSPLHVPTKLMGHYTNCPACQNRILIPPHLPPAAAASAEHESAVRRAPEATAHSTGNTTASGAGPVVQAVPPPRAERSGVAPSTVAGAAPLAQPAALWSDHAPAPAAPRAARFITADSAPTTVRLAPDGELPKLQLTEGARSKQRAHGSGMNPLLLVGAACLSFCFCAALLLIDFDAPAVDRQQELRVRQQLEGYYKNERGPLSAYQVHLREAEQARSRGDRAAEQRHYRQVLDLLHAERRDHRDRFRGLTGTPKSDEDLEELLARLLAGSTAELPDESY